MRVEEKFNLRSARLLEVQMPHVKSGPSLALGIKVTFFQKNDDAEVYDGRTLAVHMTRDEAIEFAKELLSATILWSKQ